MKAWLNGAASATAIGYLKEIVDSIWFNRNRSGEDFKYTSFGSVLGASNVIHLKKENQKRHLL